MFSILKRSQERTDIRSAMISTALCALAFIVFYYFGGKQWLASSEAMQKAIDDRHAAEAQIRQGELTTTQLQQEMDEIRSVLDQGEVDDSQGQVLKERLADIAYQIQTLSGLSEQAKAEIDAMSSRLAITRAQLLEAQALAARCQEVLSEVNDLDHQWTAEYLPLFDNDRGQKIAADREAVGEVSTLLHTVPPSSADITSWQIQLNSLRMKIDYEAVLGGDYQVSKEHLEHLNRFLTRVQAAKSDQLIWQTNLDRLLAETDSRTPVPTTLRQTIAVYEQEVLAEMNREAELKRKAELQKTIDQQSAEVQKAEEARLQAEAELLRAELDAQRDGLLKQKQQVEEQAEAARVEAQRQRLAAEFQRDQADINSLLFPFLDTNGESQPKIGPLHEPRSWHAPGRGLGPTSYSALQSAGALETTSEGLLRLYFIGGDFMNLRKKGGFPRYDASGLNNPAIVSRVTRARDLLNKYGPLLVERRMLAP